MTDMADITFDAMGSEIRLLVSGGTPEAVDRARAFIEDAAVRLSRFREDSELSALNRATDATVPASALLRIAVHAGLWAAKRTGGLIDPTLVGELERAGYRESRAGVPAPSLAAALGSAPARRAASPAPRPAWRQIEIDDEAGTITRPPGVRFDTGGTGKGLIADAALSLLADADAAVVDCGGDVALHGSAPRPVEVVHPLTGEPVDVISLVRGGIATSGIDARLWRRHGRYAHHLIDPATGEPAWTGLVGATAIAPTALEAETLAKAAVLSGPDAGRRWLARNGGLLFHDDGHVEHVGLLAPEIRTIVLQGAAA